MKNKNIVFLVNSFWIYSSKGASGGDEFVIVLVEAETKIAVQVANRILSKIRKKVFKINKLDIKKTISIGISSCPQHATSRDNLLNSADQAMYESKKRGRDQISVYQQVNHFETR